MSPTMHACSSVARSGLASLALLAGCAATPLPAAPTPAPPPDLAALVAPAPVRPAMAGPLTALLRGDRSDLLLTVGDETVRCEVSIERARSQAVCDGIVEEAPTVSALVKSLHTGDWMQRLVQARVGDPVRFVERTGLELEPPERHSDTNPFEATETAHHLQGEMLGWTRFVVGERGETVRASFTSILGDETIEARSLSALGQKIRTHQETLLEEKAARDTRDNDVRRMMELLAQVKRTPAGRWSTRREVVVGQTRLGQLALDSVEFRPFFPSETWPTSRDSMVLVVERKPGSGRSNAVISSYSSTVVQASLALPRYAAEDHILCASHDEWLAERETPFTRSSPAVATECRWSWSDASHRLDLVLTTHHSRVSITWQPAHFDEAAHTATTLVKQHRPYTAVDMYGYP